MTPGSERHSGGKLARRLLLAGLIAPILQWRDGLAQIAGKGRNDFAQGAEILSFERAVRLALDRNLDLKRARADLDLQRGLRTRELTDFLPQVELSTGATRTFGRSFSQEEGRILSETSDFAGVDVTASVSLFSGLEGVSSLRRAGLEKRASEQFLERTRQDVVFQVIEGFAAVLRNRELARVREQEYAAQQDLLGQVKGMVGAGRQPVSDLYQQQAALAEAEFALVEARRQLEDAKTGLMQVLQLNPLGNYSFELDAADSAQIGHSEKDSSRIPDYDLDSLLQAGLAGRADFGAVESLVNASRQRVREARAGYWPRLSLRLGYGSDWAGNARQAVAGTGEDPREVTLQPDDGGPPVTFPVPGTGGEPEFTRPSLPDQLDARRGGSIGLNLTMPVFDRLETRTQVRRAETALMEARYARDDMRQRIALQVRQSLMDYRSARAQLRAALKRLRAAGEARTAARRRYELGAATFVEVAQSESQYVGARSAHVRALYNLILARRFIEYATGRLDPESGFYAAEGNG